jgi:hypothetical protein
MPLMSLRAAIQQIPRSNADGIINAAAFFLDPLLAVPTAGLGVAGVAGAQPSILFRCVLLFALGDGWLIFALSFM